MSILARIKEIIAGRADGHHHALLTLADHVDGLGGLSLEDKDKIRGEVHDKIDDFLDNLRNELSGRIAEIEAQLKGLGHPTPAEGVQESAPPAPQTPDEPAAAPVEGPGQAAT